LQNSETQTQRPMLEHRLQISWFYFSLCLHIFVAFYGYTWVLLNINFNLGLLKRWICAVKFSTLEFDCTFMRYWRIQVL
jgi:hypothetical protein